MQSIQATAQCYFSQSELHKKNTDEQLKLLLERGYDWNDLSLSKQRGTACFKGADGKWFIDHGIPIFSEDRDYIKNTFKVTEIAE